jgi:D-glycero-D-manno-heptose 1,7-bisphosphate phosphatase
MDNSAIFLDKDGTLVPNVPYNVDPALMELAPGAAEGLRQMQAAGYKLIVVSNQPGVAHGYFDEAALDRVHQRLRELFEEAGVSLTDFYYCPHHPQGALPRYQQVCQCRKPAPGLLEKAACQHDLTLFDCWMIGDILHDVEAGTRAGCRTVLIDNGNETEWQWSPQRVPNFFARDLADAAEKILGEWALTAELTGENCR